MLWLTPATRGSRTGRWSFAPGWRPRTERCSCARSRQPAIGSRSGSGTRRAVPRNRGGRRAPKHSPPLAELSLAAGAAGRSGAERYQVVVHVDAGEGASVLEDGPALAPETAERLACDASLVEIVERDGVPLSVGRRTRTVPPAMRRALQARDRRCRYPGCENRRFLHAHHIRHWADGGETKLDNLVLLCSRHHRFVHEAGYSIHACGGGELEFS